MRGLLALVAVAVCIWMLIGARQSAATDQATAIVSRSHPSPSALRRARHELRRAAFLDPDRTVDILRGRVALAQGRGAQARRILASVAHAEPENLEAWVWLTGSELGRPQARVDVAHLQRLDPRDASRFSP